MLIHRTVLALLGAVSIGSTPAWAQSQPPIYASWYVNQMPVWIHYDLPPICDEPTYRAAATWNNVGAAFTLVTSNQYFYGTSILGGQRDPSRINLETSGALPDGKFMRAYLYVDAGQYDPNFGYHKIVDVDIYVNADYLYYTESGAGTHGFYCGISLPSHKLDYQSAMVHEFGHALGLDHYSFDVQDSYKHCIMYRYLGTGAIRRNPCSAEAAQLRNIYGSR